MGLFSRRRSSTDEEALSSSELYVFIRFTDPSSAADAEWSLAVSNKPAPSLHHRHSDDRPSNSDRTERSFSALTTRRSSSSESDLGSDSDSSRSSSLSPTFREFSLRPDKLTTTDIHTTTNITSSSHPFLIKILIPRTLPAKPKRKPRASLVDDLSHILRTHRSSSPESWLRSSLLQLQASHHLPPPPAFTVARLLDFAHNHLAAFRGEWRDNDIKLRELDYAAHLAENERLRAHFGHADDEDDGEGYEEGEAPRGWDMGGGWWVSWPMAEPGDRSRDVYGGLM